MNAQNDQGYRVIVVDSQGRPTGVDLTTAFGQMQLADMVDGKKIDQLEAKVAQLQEQLRLAEQVLAYTKQLLESEKLQRRYDAEDAAHRLSQANESHERNERRLGQQIAQIEEEILDWKRFATRLSLDLRGRNNTVRKLIRLFREVSGRRADTLFTKGKILGAISRVLRSDYTADRVFDRLGFGPGTNTLAPFELNRIEIFLSAPLLSPAGEDLDEICARVVREVFEATQAEAEEYVPDHQASQTAEIR